MNLQRHLASVALAVASLAAVQTLQAQAVITSGNVILGVQNWGNLNYNNNGLRSVATGHESTFDGCPCEGWGVGIAGGSQAGTWGGADENEGHFNFSSVSFTNTATTATSITTVNNTAISTAATPILRVTHQFVPTASPYLYAVNVTITNLTAGTVGSGAAGLRYTRLMDWDIEPTAFAELVTIHGNGAANLLNTTDNGFSDVNPFGARPTVNDQFGTCPGGPAAGTDTKDNGVCDHGALFDFGFAALAGGASKDFTIFYGVAPNEAAMFAALTTVGAEDVYSFGQASDVSTCGTSVGGPGNPSCETFAFGFKGVGAPPVVGTPEPASIALLATGLIGIGGFARRRRRAA